MRRLVIAGVCIAIASTLNAQWLSYPTPGIPRLPDGKPNLTAAAPKTADGKPDLSGIWEGGGARPEIKDIPLRPDAKVAVEVFRNTQNNKDSPLAKCLPQFLGQANMLYKIVQTSALIVILFDGQGMPLPRQIFTDGRPLPQLPNPSWMGYSVGHWEDSILVVETNGFHDRGMLPSGIPVTESTRFVERYERLDFGHMKIEVTMEDPKTLSKPWTFVLMPELQPDTELLEYVCEKNDDILRHMVGPK
jgi:hypothetical protein